MPVFTVEITEKRTTTHHHRVQIEAADKDDAGQKVYRGYSNGLYDVVMEEIEPTDTDSEFNILVASGDGPFEPFNLGDKIYRVRVVQLVADAELLPDDRSNNPEGFHNFHDCKDADDALEQFHSRVPIKCLSDFEITVEERK